MMKTSDLIDKLGDDAIEALELAKGQVEMENFKGALTILDAARDSIVAAMVVYTEIRHEEEGEDIPW